MVLRTGGAVTEFGLRGIIRRLSPAEEDRAWPAAELENRTPAFAERIAILSSDHLAMLKLTMNRFYENMGICSSIRSATEQDVMAQMTEVAHDFGRKFEESGMKAAVEWRDRPYERNGC